MRAIDDARSCAAPPLDQTFACKFAQSAPHGDARDAMHRCKVILGGKARAKGESAADNAIAQNQVNLACLGLLQSIRHSAPLSPPTALLGIIYHTIWGGYRNVLQAEFVA